jgi:hypothetical protein
VSQCLSDTKTLFGPVAQQIPFSIPASTRNQKIPQEMFKGLIQPDELHLGLASPIFVIEAKSLD